ncbi:YheC/YheD family protein [Thermicanus aegyptius]|uniref:YheC/YheD family endospore coat-associated protein n=1 Tax=Thermicanus aegyptius TaxID=94009 RepID=UPI0003FBE201|nr:YheC/YheD family protein [Thermicanus aegyptius]
MSNRLVGILIDPLIYQGILHQENTRENPHFYEEGAKAYGLSPIYFRLKDLRIREGTVLALTKEGTRVQRRSCPIPDIIHNRIIPKNWREREVLRRLTRSGKKIFNRVNRLSKWSVYRLLRKEPSLHPHLPQTYLANRATLTLMMNRYSNLILKPDNGSIGEGIMRLERKGKRWNLNYPTRLRNGRTRWKHISFTTKIPQFLLKRLQQRKYLVQEGISFVKKEGRPFDLRVAVQKEYGGKWKVTGIVAKVAAKGHFLTNVARGGKCHSLEEVLANHPSLTPALVESRLIPLALQAAHLLEKQVPFLADMGLDMGCNEEGHLYLIEINLRDLRITFRNAGLLEAWKRVHATPMAYAAYLLDQQERKATP